MKVSEKRRSLLKTAYSKTRRDQLVKGNPKSQTLKYMALVDYTKPIYSILAYVFAQLVCEKSYTCFIFIYFTAGKLQSALNCPVTLDKSLRMVLSTLQILAKKSRGLLCTPKQEHTPPPPPTLLV